jgi:hypothetical protein
MMRNGLPATVGRAAFAREKMIKAAIQKLRAETAPGKRPRHRLISGPRPPGAASADPDPSP